jgi:hypothetical protein
MKDKYYTPELEEFHKGFEYEIIPSIGLAIYNFSKPNQKAEIAWAKDYKKCVFMEKDSSCSFGQPFSSVAAAIEKGKCRVKYLDQEDVESLGFSHDQTTKDGAVFIKGSMMEKHEWMLTLGGKTNPPNYISIHDMNNNSLFNFSGTIKNKSELKKLLKQNGIL